MAWTASIRLRDQSVSTAASRAGQDTVLIIDEAQDLTMSYSNSPLLSNLETDNRKLLQIVLMGQPELRDRLNNPRLRQLRQRITVRYHLQPLSRFESLNTFSIASKSPAQRSPLFHPTGVWRFLV